MSSRAGLTCSTSRGTIAVFSSGVSMSRHSKWAKIKRQKGVTDAKRGQLFTKLSRAITLAAREGGSDPETNFRLRMTMERALAENMPKDNIQRAADRAAGTGDGQTMESVTLEGYGPAGAAFLIDAITDNRNRTVADIRKLLNDAGGSLGGAGSTQWMFERRGRIALEHVSDVDAAELAAIDAGATDTERDETSLDVFTTPDRLTDVRERLGAQGYTPASFETALMPKTPVLVADDTFTKIHALLEALEEHDDIVDVVTNAAPNES